MIRFVSFLGLQLTVDGTPTVTMRHPSFGLQVLTLTDADDTQVTVFVLRKT